MERERFLEEAAAGGDTGGMGTSGSVVEGAGLGEGMLRRVSLDALRRADTAGVGDIVDMGFSGRLGRCERDTRRARGGRTQRHQWMSCMSSWWTWRGWMACACGTARTTCCLRGRGRERSSPG